MKKKGFTLIELIVVIAIIGVLAAILVPAMLGYIKKSKITNANAAAKSIFTASQSAITDMDAEDRASAAVKDVSAKQTWSGATHGEETEAADKVYGQKVAQYFEDLKKLGSVEIHLDANTKATVGVGVIDNSGYPGSSPSQMSVDLYQANLTAAKVADYSEAGDATKLN